ncbi:BON domain-containing protein [Candidatus Protochlamydia phocaeensis]|uniref:BON domain-containing protein n=1 Tax=Candidatus Protochlamydia phocaeensis TaxID=1414722 RepID=UPI001E29F3F4|nr:BON domain-containing protein [Candidatus Protochlamydia phocaeensis]
MLTACETNAPDNTGRNTRDRNPSAVTPGEQSESEADRTITQKIRQALMDDDALSTNAKNVKIMTINGVVTLRGVVNNDKEKNEIGKKAKAVSGVKNVDNQIEILREGNRGTENRGDFNR